MKTPSVPARVFAPRPPSFATATFTVSASGSGFSYQWFKDGSALAGATATSLLIGGAQFANAGKYYARVTDPAGTVLNSAEARLHVVSTPTSSPWANVDNNSPTVGESVNFDATMNAGTPPGPIRFQWRKNGVPIADAQGTCTTSDDETYTAAYTINSAQCADAAVYSVVFTNDYWKIVSEPVPVQIYQFYQPVPQVTVSPSDIQITDRHSPPTLTAVVCFPSTCGQWYRYDNAGGRYFKQAIPGATGPTYTLPNPVPCDLLQPYYYFMYEAFDEGHVPHPSNSAHVYGDCEP